jgi:hypothetical protein
MTKREAQKSKGKKIFWDGELKLTCACVCATRSLFSVHHISFLSSHFGLSLFDEHLIVHSLYTIEPTGTTGDTTMCSV